MTPLGPGARLGPYVVEGVLGAGAMGTVLRARRAAGGGAVALKVLSAGSAASPQQRQRFEREAQLVARLSHPGIVRVHDAGVERGLPYFAMDLIDGSPLAERIGRLAPLEAARLVAQVARAVEHAHAQGVVHRDLKATNVLVRAEDGRAVVTDFGIGRDLEGASALTRTGALVGTPHAMSPEQACGRPAGPESDVHALGALLYEALTGTPPFEADDLPTLLAAIVNRTPEPPSVRVPGLPRALDDACLGALRKAPARRPSAGQLARALEDVAAGRPGGRAWRAPLLALGAAGVAAAVATALALRPDPSPVPAAAAPATLPPPARDPPVEAPWEEPAWLRTLDARGDLASLLAADAALEGQGQVHPRTRARATAVLRRLLASWRDPGVGPRWMEELERLLWLHAVASRVDPAHRPEASHRAAILGWGATATSGSRGERLVRNARAAIRAFPDDVAGYLRYAEATGPRFPHGDGALLRRGLEVARDPAPRATLAGTYARWLQHVGDAEPARAAWVAAELQRVARWLEALPAADPAALVEVLLVQAEREEDPGQAARLFARMEELVGPRVDVLVTAAGAARRRHEATGDPRRAPAASATFERALQALERASPPAPEGLLTRLLEPALDGLERRGDLEPALAACERALAAPGEGPRAALAARRALYLARLDRPDPAVQAALRDLSVRAATLERGRAAPGERAAPSDLVAALNALALEHDAGAASRAQVAERLAALLASGHLAEPDEAR